MISNEGPAAIPWWGWLAAFLVYLALLLTDNDDHPTQGP